MTPETSHGAYSEKGLRPRKTTVKRQFLKARGLRESALDPVTRDLLDDYVELRSVASALFEHMSDHGLVDDRGEPLAPLRAYTSVVNSMQRAKRELEAHLAKTTAEDPQQALNRYLAETYGSDEDGDE
jgi:hypothetical protein